MSKMLTISEAAEHFKVSTATIRRWIRSGRVRSQLTLGPFGEQWMVDPDDKAVVQASPAQSIPLTGASSAYVAVDQLVERESEKDEVLLQEAERALQEAWQAREAAEKELAELRARSATPDLLALRCDLEGSERKRLQLVAQVEQLESGQSEAWQETRTALQALGQAYQQMEELSRRLHVLERESECFRRALAQRLGLDWREHDTLQLFLRWESAGDFPTASMERPNWSSFRRQAISEEVETG